MGLGLPARGRAIGRFGWGLADQAVSSLTNVAVSFYLVHTLAPAAYGAFSLAYISYGFVLNASRGLATDPLMVRFSGVTARRWQRGVAEATGTAISVGFAAGILVIAAAFRIGGITGSALLALGITLPGLMLQDGWRYSFFARSQGSKAFANDMVWAIVLVPSIVVLRMSGHASVFWVVLAWGAAANVAAVAGLFQAGTIPRLLSSWIRTQRDLGVRYLAEGLINNAGLQVRGYGVGLLLGLASLGYLQAAVTLTGPTTILFAAMGLVTIPEAARFLRRSPAHMELFCLALSAGLGALGFLWGITLLIGVPRGLGDLLLGPIWRPVYPLILPVAIGLAGTGLGTGPGCGLHALGASKRSLRVAFLRTVLYIGCSLSGAVLGGVTGACWGSTLSIWMAVVMSWWELRVALRNSGVQRPAGIAGLLRALRWRGPVLTPQQEENLSQEASSKTRSLARHLPRVGPMLPTGSPSWSEISA